MGKKFSLSVPKKQTQLHLRNSLPVDCTVASLSITTCERQLEEARLPPHHVLPGYTINTSYELAANYTTFLGPPSVGSNT